VKTALIEGVCMPAAPLDSSDMSYHMVVAFANYIPSINRIWKLRMTALK
jgi:hypothetical protein